MSGEDEPHPAPWRTWLAAARPRTLPAAVAPVVVGSAVAGHDHRFDPAAASLCLAFALLVQVATNFANDYYDFVKGADTASRVGPRRAVASGLVAPAVMRRAMAAVFAAAFAVGLCLVHWGGPWMVAVGVASIVCGIAYTGGPFPLGYLGFGDLFVFLFFGLVAVTTTYFVQAGRVTLPALLAGVPVGLLTANILLVNNYRDADTDAAAGKRTLVVRLGPPFRPRPVRRVAGPGPRGAVRLLGLGIQGLVPAAAAHGADRRVARPSPGVGKDASRAGGPPGRHRAPGGGLRGPVRCGRAPLGKALDRIRPGPPAWS